MVNVNEAVIARLKKQGRDFEILVDCDLALAYKAGKEVDLDSVVVSFDVFEDVKKGMNASDAAMESAFGTTDKKEVVKKILKEGEIQLTAEYRKKLRDKKRKQIIHLIHRNAIDPKTGAPHPPQRIENAINEVKVHIDDFKPAEQQVKEIVAKILSVLPLKYEIREVQVVLGPQYGGRAMPTLRKFGKVLKEEWLNDGSLCAVVEIPAGIQEEFEKELNNLTRGDLDLKILNAR